MEHRMSVTLMGIQSDISRAQKKLDAQKVKYDSSSQILSSLKDEVDKAKSGLVELQNLNASATAIADQQALVDKREAAYEKAMYDGSLLTQAAAAEEGYEIDVLKGEVATREQQIADIKAELATR